MKHLRFLSSIIVIILIFNLISCNQAYLHSGSKPSHPSGSGTPTQPESTVQPIKYVYSITQKKLHLDDCYHIEFMNEEFRFEYSGDISVLLEKGYTICKDCLVVDDEDDEDDVFVPDEDEVSAEEANFVVNRSSLTFHIKGCRYTEKMSPKNVKYTRFTFEELLETEHAPCGHCMPEEYKAYKEANPDKFNK